MFGKNVEPRLNLGKCISLGLVVLLMAFMSSCRKMIDSSTLFTKIESANSGIDFTNTVENTDRFNIFSYRNFYNGGGVAVGDINNDGLIDVFFTSNMGSNKLYLNKGDFKFEDISSKAGIEDTDKWSTGVVIVDINHDGFLDIYVCNAGYRSDGDQKNTLYLNNGDLTFEEAATDFGLDESGYSTHAAFFDYDLDGDLDVYMLNNSFIPVNTLNYSNKRDLRAKDWPVKEFLKGGGDKLLRNDDGRFTDVSEEAGIYGSLIGFGLGVNIADLNQDGWLDIYVCNDFFERDYFYINQKDGTFEEGLESYFEHISLSSMGADIADVNNDGLSDLFVTDMLPDDTYRLKTTATFENIDVYRLKQESGFYHQFMQNGLHINSTEGKFKDLAYFSGVAASDWSWGALMFDANNDSHVDLLVCNGIYHDVIDQDFIDFFANDVIQKMTLSGKKEAVNTVIENMPSIPIQNKFFLNKGGLNFEDFGSESGLKDETFSNGSAYADLDNDGDLDLIINNVNQEALLYRNNSKANYLTIELAGKGTNANAIGASVTLFADSLIQTKVLVPSRGFQSSVDCRLHFGLGDRENVDSILVIWPDLSQSLIDQLDINAILEIDQSKVNLRTHSEQPFKNESTTDQSWLTEVTIDQIENHKEDEFTDYYFERNLSQATSQEGPKIAVGDINKDGYDDLYVCGAAGERGQLLYGGKSGFKRQKMTQFIIDKPFEDTAAEFIDVDNDGDLDLYVGSGGNNHPVFSAEMQDRLYINVDGEFKRDPYALPAGGMNTSVIAPYDYDRDGDVDIFVGSRSIPSNYGISPASYLLQNVNGKFKDVSKAMNPEIFQAGLVTDAKWIDVVGGRLKELLIVGEWMEPKIFSFTGKTFRKEESSLADLKGWWLELNSIDLDKDGDLDLILGNKGENFYLKPSVENPAKLWLGDFDKSGQFQTVLTFNENGKDYPVASKRDFTDQFNFLKKQNLKHTDFADRGIYDLFGEETMSKMSVKTVNYSSSCIAINEGNGDFEIMKLPAEVQYSSVNASLVVDLDGDGFDDLLLGGNDYDFLPQFSRLDASFGHALFNERGAGFKWVQNSDSGFFVEGEVKDIRLVQEGAKESIIVGVNNEAIKAFRFVNESEIQ